MRFLVLAFWGIDVILHLIQHSSRSSEPPCMLRDLLLIWVMAVACQQCTYIYPLTRLARANAKTKTMLQTAGTSPPQSRGTNFIKVCMSALSPPINLSSLYMNFGLSSSLHQHYIRDQYQRHYHGGRKQGSESAEAGDAGGGDS